MKSFISFDRLVKIQQTLVDSQNKDYRYIINRAVFELRLVRQYLIDLSSKYTAFYSASWLNDYMPKDKKEEIICQLFLEYCSSPVNIYFWRELTPDQHADVMFRQKNPKIPPDFDEWAPFINLSNFFTFILLKITTELIRIEAKKWVDHKLVKNIFTYIFLYLGQPAKCDNFIEIIAQMDIESLLLAVK